jgi:hypothetical protein
MIEFTGISTLQFGDRKADLLELEFRNDRQLKWPELPELSLTCKYQPAMAVDFNSLMPITITLPPRKGVRLPGGRLLRKSRLRKKRDKALLALGLSRTYHGYITSFHNPTDGQPCELRFSLSPSCS